MSTQRGGRGSGAGSSSSHSRKGKSPMSHNTPTVPFQLMDEEVEIPEEWQQEFEAQAARASVGFEDIPEEEEHLPTQESESVRPSQTRTSGSLRSDIFAIHYKRDEQNNKAICNHCGKNYAFVKGGGYGSLNKHLQNCHPDKVGVDTRQTQFPRGGFTGECQDQLTQLKEIFNRFDMDNDGSLTLLELAALLRSLGLRPTGDQIHTLSANMDANGNGAIEFEELVETIMPDLNEQVIINQDQLMQVFQSFDRDGNGYISAVELAGKMAKMGQALTYGELTEMIQEADTNGDGVISFNEFANIMAKSAVDFLNLPPSWLSQS